MTKKKIFVIALLALCGGLLGGTISSQLFDKAFADKNTLHEKVVKAEKFELVDANGTVFATLSQTDCTVSLKLGSTDESLIHFTVSENIAAMVTRSRQYGSVDLSADFDGPRLSIQDPYNNSRAVLGQVRVHPAGKDEKKSPDPFALVFYDQRGRILWAAPES